VDERYDEGVVVMKNRDVIPDRKTIYSSSLHTTGASMVGIKCRKGAASAGVFKFVKGGRRDAFVG